MDKQKRKEYYRNYIDRMTPEQLTAFKKKKAEQNKRFMQRKREQLSPEEYEVFMQKKRDHHKRYRDTMSEERKEQKRLKYKLWTIKNPDYYERKVKERWKRYYEENKEKILERQRKWAKENPEKARESGRTRNKRYKKKMRLLKQQQQGTMTQTNPVQTDVHTVHLKYGLY